MKPKLSLALIGKDEKDALTKLLTTNDLYKYVDEIVLVSGDKNLLAYAERYTFPVKIFYRKWKNDFAAARNYSFDKATGDVIMWADLDDTIEHPEKLPELAQKIIDGHFDWVTMRYDYEFDEYGNCIMVHWKPRLTRAETGNWVGSVHETYIAHKAVSQVRDEDVVIVHHQEPGHRKESGERNLKILLDEFNRDKEKTDPRTLYYLGSTLMETSPEEAIPFFRLHIKQCGWPEEKYFSIHYLSKCLIWTGRIDEAINASLEATKILPQWSLAYYDVAEGYMYKEDWGKEIQWILTGTTKETPDPATYFVNPLDYELTPFARLVDAYLQIHNFPEAVKLAKELKRKFPNHKDVDDMYKDCRDVEIGENFVRSFINVAGYIRDKDRLKAVKLFDALPIGSDMDKRIQEARRRIVPPKVWEDRSIVIYCHPGHEEWAYPSLFIGVGGSEEMVIRQSAELQKLGFKVTVYCKCGTMAGTYQGVEYKPYYHFNPEDQFDTLIIWRYAGFMNDVLHAKQKYVWLHDIVHESTFNDKIIKNTDKFLFLSKWHRNNVPGLPEEKVYITRNALDPKDFTKIPDKKSNTLVWTSSYDRGAVCLGRDILPLIEKEIPDVTLDIAYGTANLEKEMDKIPYLKETYDEMQKIFKKPNVRHHGRLPHQKVHELQAQSMIHAYASEFGETFNISSIKAQANGAYVITTSQAGATPEYVRFGKVLEGNGIYGDKKLQREYADEVIKFLKEPVVLTEEARKQIIDEYSVARLAKEWQKDLLT